MARLPSASAVFSDRQLRHFRRHGLKAGQLVAFINGDLDVIDATSSALMQDERTDKARAWLVKALHDRLGPSWVVVETAKRLWYGAHDYIGFLLGLEALQALAEHDHRIPELPLAFTAWRAEWRVSSGFLSPVRSWATTEDGARNYLGPGKVLVQREVQRHEVLLYIPATMHMSRVGEIVLAPAGNGAHHLCQERR